MPIVYDKLLALKIPEVEHSYGPKDCMLYALGVGLGLDPMDEQQLAFVYEKNLKVLPTMAVVIGYPGFWAKELDTGIDWVKVVAGEHSAHAASAARARGHRDRAARASSTSIDKGAGKGALVYSERTIDDKATRRAHRHHHADHVLPRRRRLRRAAARAARRCIRSRSARPIWSATCRRARRRR